MKACMLSLRPSHIFCQSTMLGHDLENIRHRPLKLVLVWGGYIFDHHCFLTFSQYLFLCKPKQFRAPGSERCRHSSQWSSGPEGWPCTAASRSESDTRWQPGASSPLSSAETRRHHMQGMSSHCRIMGFNRIGQLAWQSWTRLCLRPKSSPGYLTAHPPPSCQCCTRLWLIHSTLLHSTYFGSLRWEVAGLSLILAVASILHCICLSSAHVLKHIHVIECLSWRSVL